MVTIRQAVSQADLERVKELFREYWSSFGFTPCFQDFGEEVDGLPGRYALPQGRLALAWVEEQVAGCMGLRRLDAKRCEAKRLYVRPGFRGHGVGRALLEWCTAEARAAGYEEMMADTLPVMAAALAMYERAGFRRTGPYAAGSAPEAIFLRLDLQQEVVP